MGSYSFRTISSFNNFGTFVKRVTHFYLDVITFLVLSVLFT